jgi:hypothetical protein
MLVVYGLLDRGTRTKIVVSVRRPALGGRGRLWPSAAPPPKGDDQPTFDEWLSLKAVLSASIVRSGEGDSLKS